MCYFLGYFIQNECVYKCIYSLFFVVLHVGCATYHWKSQDRIGGQFWWRYGEHTGVIVDKVLQECCR